MFEVVRAKGWLTVTTVLIGGKVAAVDVGCLREGVHLVLAGGTSGDFPGVAKLINLHHIETACAERYEEVDFLCGDFTWKKIFHLTPRPLYLVERKSE
jgi:CelD/BcsL family acetyltransferase involved in cellulose biosynthesis